MEPHKLIAPHDTIRPYIPYNEITEADTEYYL